MKFNYIKYSPTLSDIKIVKDMVRMYEAYRKSIYFDTSIYPDEDYLFYWKTDPVYYLLSTYFFYDTKPEYDLDYNEIKTAAEVKRDLVNYAARVFYSVKGTKEVFTQMESLLGLKFYNGWRYDGKELFFRLIELDNIKTINDESEFFYNLSEFLQSLLFIHPNKIDIGSMITFDGIDSYNSDPRDNDPEDPDSPDNIYRHKITGTINAAASVSGKSYKIIKT